MLQRFGGVGAVELGRCERESGHRPGADRDAVGHELQHGFGQVEGADARAREFLQQDAGEAAFASAHVEHPGAVQFAQVLED